MDHHLMLSLTLTNVVVVTILPSVCKVPNWYKCVASAMLKIHKVMLNHSFQNNMQLQHLFSAELHIRANSGCG